MAYTTNCNNASISPYNQPLDFARAFHLYRRLGFSASAETVKQAVGKSAVIIVEDLMNQAMVAPLIESPTWADWTNANYSSNRQERIKLQKKQGNQFRLEYTKQLLANGLRDRLSFFWSNHFVTRFADYDCPAFLHEYVTCLQRNSLGNFKIFVSEIGLTSAMLYFLDGAFNNAKKPNENYARELYELFTLGEGNDYTEEDIVATAKSLTGYVDRGTRGCTPVTFKPSRFDDSEKTIFEQSGNWNYDDVITILFQERTHKIAIYICEKLYEFFVHPNSKTSQGNTQPVIISLANTFTANNFELVPVLKQLFQSEHFFDENAIGVIIKSPFDFYLNTLRETNFEQTDAVLKEIINYSELVSQDLFNPIDVAGWQRDRSWINNNFLIGRWRTMETILETFYKNDSEQYRTLGLAITGDIGLTTNNPDKIARLIVNFFLPRGLLNPNDYIKAFAVFRSDIEEAYYEGGDQETWTLATWQNGSFQVYLLLLYITKQPEFQLK